MKLATVRHAGATRAALVTSTGFDSSQVTVELFGEDYPDVAALLTAEAGDLFSLPRSGPLPVARQDFCPVIPTPGKIIATGLNYASHIKEMGHSEPDVPTLFAVYADALTDPYATVTVTPPNAQALDYEGELAVIIGAPIARADDLSADDVLPAIGGYTVFNDLSLRDRQYKTKQWLQGKNLDKSKSFGPWLVTTDEFNPDHAIITTTINGEVRQEAPLSDLVFSPGDLVAYISSFIRLNPGDVIATGTTGGVGWAATPKKLLADGDECVVTVTGIGSIVTTVHIS